MTLLKSSWEVPKTATSLSLENDESFFILGALGAELAYLVAWHGAWQVSRLIDPPSSHIVLFQRWNILPH